MAPNVTSQGRQSSVKKPKNRHTKTHLVFDEKARTEYLTGFRKRKAERRKKFNEKLKKELKEERKKLQTELREKIKKSNRDVPEVAHLLDNEKPISDIYDLPEATVTISSITDSQLRDENVFLGSNTTTKKGNESEDDGPVVDKKKQIKNINREAMKKLKKTKTFKKISQVNRDKARKKSRQKLRKRK